MNRTFLGTGRIGAAMASAALRRGERVTVWNRTATRAIPLVEQGATRCEDAAEAVAGADLVHLALRADSAVDQVLAHIARSLPEEAIVLDHSTTSPQETAARGRWCVQRGLRFLHAPVFMSPAACQHARGTMLVAGPTALWERARPALDGMTGELWYVGERADLAAVLKLCGNAVLVGLMASLAEAYAIAAAEGVAPGTVRELFLHFDPSRSIDGRGARMAAGDYRPSWALGMARKDVGLMRAAARGQSLPVLDAVARRMDQLVEAGHAEADLAVLAVDTLPTRD